MTAGKLGKVVVVVPIERGDLFSGWVRGEGGGRKGGGERSCYERDKTLSRWKH